MKKITIALALTMGLVSTANAGLRQDHSYCAGFYNAQAIGEMGSFSSTFNLLFNQEFSPAQKLAVRLFTEQSNAYKRMGGIDQEYYDQGGMAGGDIFMSGQASFRGKKVGYADLDNFCKGLFRGKPR
ncbi:hypothetical protein HWB92_gp099 [Serratia phage vB_SmaA_3M]|uniref:Uncharacterized protein n=1 Tax=Serratia phage vB_SmaA_3M TaxID=2419930 RepID=A0A3G2YS74_9CAUD|nr:hypothetical protein HWB92_gp099 [Serratia phage vB_SmaA_3M]AYP28357.1 hypothetical protein 3M_101 [Serratia phage vB_SmaA_3M]